MPNSEIHETKGGVVYSYTNDTDTSVEPRYACVTAPGVVECAVAVDGELVDKVYAGAGGSHSWWKEAGGGLLKFPLKPGQTLTITLSGEGAFRIDWY